EADDLAHKLAAVAGDDAAAVADGKIVLNARHFDQETLDGGDLAEDLMGRQALELAQERRNVDHGLSRICTPGDRPKRPCFGVAATGLSTANPRCGQLLLTNHR